MLEAKLAVEPLHLGQNAAPYVIADEIREALYQVTRKASDNGGLPDWDTLHVYVSPRKDRRLSIVVTLDIRQEETP